MFKSELITADNKISLWKTLVTVTLIWVVSDLAFYTILPLIGFPSSYNAEPIGITWYYLVWVVVTIIALRSLFKSWRPIDTGWRTYLLLTLVLVGMVFFLTFILPVFPPIEWKETQKPPSELLFATSWYFLPKTIEILLQQLLVAALVLTFSARGFSLRSIIVWCAVLFGAGHLLLIFGGSPLWYVARFTVSAFVAGLIFPYLLLRVKNGFVFTFVLHWLFYAGTIFMIHTVSPYANL